MFNTLCVCGNIVCVHFGHRQWHSRLSLCEYISHEKWISRQFQSLFLINNGVFTDPYYDIVSQKPVWLHLSGWCCFCIPTEKSNPQRTRSAHAGYKKTTLRKRWGRQDRISLHISIDSPVITAYHDVLTQQLHNLVLLNQGWHFVLYAIMPVEWIVALLSYWKATWL